MSRHRRVPVVGLVGGIGSGKSTLARAVASRHPVVVIDGDRVGHELLHWPDVKEQIRQRFGADVFDADGNVIRRMIAERVFGETEPQREARRDLEQILHPRMREQFTEQINACQSDPGCHAVLLDAAVLFEAGWNDVCDSVVFIETPPHLRIQRVQDGRGWTVEQLAAREASQWSLERKRAAADEVIENCGSVESAASRLEAILHRLAANSGQAAPA